MNEEATTETLNTEVTPDTSKPEPLEISAGPVLSEEAKPTAEAPPAPVYSIPIPQVLFYPDPRLRVKAKPVEVIDDKIIEKVKILFQLLMQHGGIGLAATQVGWDEKILVMNLTGDPEDGIALINPEIVEQGKKKEKVTEACLSLPGVYAKVERPISVKIRALSTDTKKPIEFTQTGQMARCLQHEMDHLDGVLFIDRVSLVNKRKLKKPLKALQAYRKAVMQISKA